MLVTAEQARGLRAWVGGVLAGVYRPLPKEEIYEWAERTLRIPASENQELAGKLWDSSLTPYVRELMRWVKQPGKSEMFISKSSQVGYTMAILIIICWHIVNRQVNIGYCIDSVPEARKISKSRLMRWISENRLLSDIGENEDDLSNLTYYFRGMTVHLMGAYSAGAFGNKSLDLGVLDELDKHPLIEGEGTTADLMRERLKRPRNSKLIGLSTPTLESGQTWMEYLTGTQEKMHLPCPHCGLLQPLIWKNVIYKGKEFEDLLGNPDLQQIRDRAYYQCEAGCRIEHTEKRAMMLDPRADWVAGNAKKAKPNKRSQQISDLYSPFAEWGELAVEWIEAQGNREKMRRFVLGRLGEPFRDATAGLDEKDVLSLRNAAYKKGEIPIVPALISMQIDVQESGPKWVKTGWTLNGDCYVIDYGAELALEDLEERMNSPIRLPGGAEGIVQAGLIDEGYQATRIRKWAIEYMPRIYTVKGIPNRQVRHMVSTSDTWVDGVEILVYHIDDDGFKRQLYHGMIRDREKNIKYGRPRLHLPQNVDPWFVAELHSEKLEKGKNEYGFEVVKWHLPNGQKNDYGDCLKYGLALWTIMAPTIRAAAAEEAIAARNGT